MGKKYDKYLFIRADRRGIFVSALDRQQLSCMQTDDSRGLLLINVCLGVWLTSYGAGGDRCPCLQNDETLAEKLMFDFVQSLWLLCCVAAVWLNMISCNASDRVLTLPDWIITIDWHSR